ncbi:M28 family peptidase [Novosphingobium album (ex Hu et al. 2023)]|uniref:M28 family peptidase n=1 Tax=Novosphingobium album (ex Hu et al. 2023) TaxID=2930093 RepID=A0ABT0AWW8_9SPHN|nr:M28 family peptidase [Novosphingobium album (ex Hu et al. 2023)]MCJ2177108.1 M28 family peptidase [Novosphingobium album (ex Hu et al. 2023)]
MGRKVVLASFAVLLITLSGPSPARPNRADRELEARLRAHIEVLASDDFDGREPGTDGEARTLRYLGREWYNIGLVSGTNDPGNEWFAPVTLVAREPAASSARFLRKGYRTPIAPQDVLVLTSGKRSLVRNAPLLFLGRAEGAEFTRNELAGRIAVLLDGDTPDSKRQNELLAMGASAVLTVLDGDRNMEEVAARRQRSGYALADDSLGGDLEAFISRDSMEMLLKGTAHSLDDLEKAAAEPGFAPFTLDVSASLEATTRETTIHTHNLIAKLPGKHPEAGAVLFLAHWDHFGECGDETAEDRICNGAIDNASGVAALTEVARRLARGPQLDRDVYFLSTTAEELGLLGAHAFAENPPLPLDHIVAAFNIDSDAIAPAGTPFTIVGRGMTGLDSEIAKVARAGHFKLLVNDEANEYVRRQDGWALLQHDIPAVMVTTAYGKIELMRDFFEGDYHRPSDDLEHLSHPLQLGGAMDDVKMLTALGRWFADPRKVPFKAGL